MMKKLLLADDSITIQKVVGIILSTEDYQLEITDDGDRAFTKALEEIPDLVIADVSMPGKDGFELCRAIKSEPRLSNTSVLLLPGAFDHFDETKADEVCADGWLTKPFESQALLDKISQLLEADPVKMAGVTLAENVEVPVADQVGESDLETMSEAALGLDAVDTLASPVEEVDEESPDDIWDAVSFAEEDLQTQVEPVTETFNDNVSFAADVIDPTVKDEVVLEPALDEPVVSTFGAEVDEVDSPVIETEADLVTEKSPMPEGTESFQSDAFAAAEFGEVTEEDSGELSEPYEPLTEIIPSPLPKEDEPVDFSVFSEAEDEFPLSTSGDDADSAQFTSDDEPPGLEEASVSNIEAVDNLTSGSEDEDVLDLMTDELVEQNTEETVVEEETGSFVVAAEDATAPELPEEDSSGESVQGEEDIDAPVVKNSLLSVTDNATDNDEIIDLLEEDIEPVEEHVEPLDDYIEPVEEEIEPVGKEVEPVEEDIELVEEEIELVEEEIEPVEEEIEPVGKEVEPVEEDIELVEEDIELVEEEIELVEEEIEPVGKPESISAESDEETFYFDESGVDNQAVTPITTATTTSSVTEQVEQQLRELSEDNLKEVVAKVAGPIIEKLASEMLEQIAWEVVPDLAEAMISEEIRKIKEGEE